MPRIVNGGWRICRSVLARGLLLLAPTALPAAEPNIAELTDGRVLVTARNSDPRNRRVAA